MTIKSIKDAKAILLSPPLVCSGILSISIIALTAALTTQYGFGLEPCVLCLYQRVPYVLTALLGFIGLLFALKNNHKIVTVIIALSALTFLCGAVIAFYHTGVEQHWWISFLDSCQGDASGSIEDILARIKSSAAVPCDKIPWQMFGISMAGYNTIMSLGLSIGCALSTLFLLKPNRT